MNNFTDSDNRMGKLGERISTENLWKWAKIFFVLCVWFAALIDLPVVVENMLSIRGEFYIPVPMRSTNWENDYVIAPQYPVLSPLYKLMHSSNKLYTILVDFQTLLETENFNLGDPIPLPGRTYSWWKDLKPFYNFLHNINTSYEVPWHKLGKDVFFLLAVACVLIIAIRQRWLTSVRRAKTPVWLIYLNLVGLIALMAIISLVRNGIWTAAIGIRAHLPILAFLVGVNIKKKELNQMWLWLRPMFLIEFVFAVIQRWVQLMIEITYDGQRSSGTFFQINALSLLIVAFLIFLLYVDISRWARLSYVAIVFAMAVLTRSRMAILMCIVVIIIFGYTQLRSERLRKMVILGMILLIPAIPLVLGGLTGRYEIIRHFFEMRGSGPIDYLFTSSFQEKFLGEGLGRGATLMYTVESASGVAPVSNFDTLIGSSLVQGGIPLVVFTMAFIISPLLRSASKYLPLALSTVALIGSIMIPLLEVWPANLLLMMFYGYVAMSQVSGNHDSEMEFSTQV